ncbi:alkyl sulfatase dimerization domain-containing protein [Variovorax sp. M-6]|uniref:alkyl sulfatase dimerization domain-containing protein n=1 Tax=Variovorax sp. M-6 TaxID=3233041 RepID=UPI003F94DD06
MTGAQPWTQVRRWAPTRSPSSCRVTGYSARPAISRTTSIGLGALLERARKDFQRGEHRWVAEVTNHLAFAQPGWRSSTACSMSPSPDSPAGPAARSTRHAGGGRRACPNSPRPTHWSA